MTSCTHKSYLGHSYFKTARQEGQPRQSVFFFYSILNGTPDKKSSPVSHFYGSTSLKSIKDLFTLVKILYKNLVHTVQTIHQFL